MFLNLPVAILLSLYLRCVYSRTCTLYQPLSSICGSTFTVFLPHDPRTDAPPPATVTPGPADADDPAASPTSTVPIAGPPRERPA